MFPEGNGGVVGIAVGHYLRSRFAVLGTTIIIVSTWAVGAILLADTVVLMFLQWVGHGLHRLPGFASPALSAAKEHSESMGNIWKKLSSRQREVFSKDERLSERPDLELEGVMAPKTSTLMLKK